MVDMCIKAEGMCPDGVKSTVELIDLVLGADEQETRDLIKAIKEGLDTKGIGRKVTVKLM